MTATLAPFMGRHEMAVSPNAPGTDISSLDPKYGAQLFASNSLLLFRDFAVSTAGFRKFSEDLCGEFMSYDGGASVRGVVDGDRTLMTVSEPSHKFAIPLHGEMYYAKHRPRILWFYCVRPAAEAGETTVADGAAIYDRLSDDARLLFERNRIRYICTHSDSRWQAAFGADDLRVVQKYCDANDLTFRWNDADRSVTTDYVSTAIADCQFEQRRVFINNILTMTHWESQGHRHRIVRLEDGRPIPESTLSELRELEATLTVAVPWRAGDVLMVDNTRYLHGRRAFTDAGREIYVRLSGALRDEHDRR